MGHDRPPSKIKLIPTPPEPVLWTTGQAEITFASSAGADRTVLVPLCRGDTAKQVGDAIFAAIETGRSPAQPGRSMQQITLPLEYVRALYKALDAMTDLLEGPLHGATVEGARTALTSADVAEDYVSQDLLLTIEPGRAF